jgi:superfamily II DNA or RNA helicase
MATGLGKTVVAGEVLRRLFDDGCKTALVLCHSQDLALQLERAFWPHLNSSEKTSVFFAGSPPRRPEGATFGLYQTMQGYLSSVDPHQYDVVIVDESHHAVASGFLACIQHLTPKLLLGMTATPWRGDGDSIDRVFGPPVSRLSLVDGMSMGYLAQVDYRIFSDNINWEEIPRLAAKTLSIKDLNKRLFLPQRDDAAVVQITKVLREEANPKVIVFSPSIAHARRFSELLNAAQIPARCVSGLDRTSRQRALMEFASDNIVALVGVDILNEGIDLPEVNILVFMRATHSRRIFIQQLGRGLRIKEGKSRVIVLDFVSDVRRLAEVVQMDRAARVADHAPRALYLKDGFVKFEDVRVGSFVEEWLRDIADIADESESHQLTFPVVP